MTKEQAIEKLTKFQRDLEVGEGFSGRAGLIKELDKMVRFLTLHKANDNLPELFVKEANQKLAAIK